MPSTTNIHFGTCSWKYDSWKGLVYPHYDKQNYLEEYAKTYGTVEVDQWFWSLFAPGSPVVLPKQKDTTEYDAATPDDFRFTIKAPNAITLTHYYPKFAGTAQPSSHTSKGLHSAAGGSQFTPPQADHTSNNPHFLSVELWNKFVDSLGPLKHKTAAAMLQFEYLNKQKMPDPCVFMKQLEDFLKAIPREVPVAVETRNPNYLNNEFFTLLHDQGVIPVFLQGYFMPPVFETVEKFRHLIPGKAIIRLHGPDRSGIEQKTGGIWNKIVDPKDEEIHKLGELIKTLAEMDTEVFVNVNNHYEGSAPLTIEKIKSLLKDGQ
ncbi:MAG: hypothetical protein AMXMBFR49_23570 [Chlorobiota bacterium]